MPLSKILEHISQKGKIPERNRPKEVPHKTTSSSIQNSLRVERNGDKRPDPVVAKLKASRKEEVEKLKNLRDGKKKGDFGTLSLRDKAKADGVYEKRQSQVPSNIGDNADKKPARKLKYNELMKKASKIDTGKLQISTQKKSNSPSSQQLGHSKQKTPSKANSTHASVGERTRKAPTKESNSEVFNGNKQDREKQKLPTRQPSQKLQQKLKELRKSQSHLEKATGRTANPSYYEEEDDDSDSFIASDEEEMYGNEADPGYDRDEIWALFNRGKKRSHFENNDLDYDSAEDMEATGSEVLREEMRSRKNAELEDQKELEEEKRLAALKRAKKLKSKV